MYVDPSQWTLGEVSSAIRDFSIVAVLITAAWKARGLYEDGVKWFQRWNRHMEVMEQGQTQLLTGMETLLGNHLKHIEADLAQLSGRNRRADDPKEV